MAEPYQIRSKYFTPMDKSYYEPINKAPSQNGFDKPIVSTEKWNLQTLGETVPENLGQSNIIQTTQAAIRGGAGTIQLIAFPAQDSIGRTLGGRIGKEVRETLKEIRLASKVEIAGIELPNTLRNLNGFDYQQRAFTEDERKRGLEEVKDAIKFVGDVMNGGDVDVISWEFPRAVNNAKWNTDGKFERDSEQEKIAFLVDTRSGRTAAVQKEDKQYLPVDKKTFERFTDKDLLDPETGKQRPLEVFQWGDFEEWARKNTEKNKKEGFDAERPETAEELYVRAQLKAQKDQLVNSKLRSEDFARHTLSQLKDAQEEEQSATTDEEKRKAHSSVERFQKEYRFYLESAAASEQNVKDLEEREKNYKPMNEYGVMLSAQSYAEAGIEALRETATVREREKESGQKCKDVTVGPEIGWPDYYGSHPQEFKELILKARERMVELITKPEVKNERDEPVKSEYFDPSIKKEDAETFAKKHIKGVFDTGHVGMWLSNFKYEDDPQTKKRESEERHLKRFNEWFEKEVKSLADDPRELVSGLQLVDSNSAAHGHLPPGEGIFPVMKTAELFKKQGFKGFMVSEGHDEERFGRGRIRTKLWQKAGAPVGSGYFGQAGAPMRWTHAAQGYFGKTYSPLFMFGSYAPSNEFKLWSEIPLE